MTQKNNNQPAGAAAGLRMEPVDGGRALKRFIQVPMPFYRDDPNWVPPLVLERRLHLSKHNPYFKHARWQAWIAWRGNTAVGRISAQIDQLHLDTQHDGTGFFGLIEAEDDPAVFSLLLDTAEQWLSAAGMTQVRGPYNLSINHDCGLLIEGFGTPPAVMMPHTLPYYPAHLERHGYHGAQDLLAYDIASDFDLSRGMQALIAKSADQIQVRPLRRKSMDDDFHAMRRVFNDAWSRNWGFVPFTEAEFLDVGHTMAHLIDDDFVQIAEVDGQAVGMIVLLPNLNEVIADLDGRLLPFGWLKLLWRLKKIGTQSGRIPLMGIVREHQGSLLGTALVYRLIAALRAPARREGIRRVEMSWILDDNQPMRNIIESLGGTVTKRYRVYEKTLPA